jgi:uncharacterized protein (DUF2252 family)
MADLPLTSPERRKQLDALRNQKMARSAHAFLRGTTDHFYEWLINDLNVKSIPSGPPIWICGDCHTGNLGPIADVGGDVDIQIRDFDQTVIGNPAHDLLRLALSMATAARSSDLPGVVTATIVEEMVATYSEVIAGRKRKERAKDVAPVDKVLKNSLHRKWRNLAEERIKDPSPHIPLGRNFWPLQAREKAALATILKNETEKRLVPTLIGCDSDAEVKLCDAAYWVKGCSSLGLLRYAVLVKVGKKHRLLDFKEAVTAKAPCAKNGKAPADSAKRVVTGATFLSPFLGERMFATSLLGIPFFSRELRPQDLKIELARISAKEAVSTAKLLASVVAMAHGRQLDRGQRVSGAKELRKSRSKSLNAPSWLWNAAVELLAEHESAYLRHCRKFSQSSAES